MHTLFQVHVKGESSMESNALTKFLSDTFYDFQ